MSLPREILDQLLSGYLDDALSADERARVDQLVRDDAEIARELEDLRQLSGSLRAISEADRQLKLEPGFADRVLDNAVARATAEGLGEDHPLVQLAAQPSTASEPKSAGSWRIVGAVLALAASLAIAFVAFRDDSDPVDPNLIVQVPPVDPIEQPDLPIDDPGDTRIAVVDPDPDKVVTPEMVAATDPNRTDVPGRSEVNDPAVDDVTPGNTDVVAVEQKPTPNDQMPAETRLQGTILVWDVRRTELGRETGAVSAAMRKVSIESKQKDITEEVVAFVSDAVADPGDATARLLFLEALATKVDEFYLQLNADLEGIASIQMTLAEDPPLMGVVQSIKSVDPTKVRHGVSWQLESESPEAYEALLRNLSGRPFPFEFPRGEPLPPMPKGDGPNVMARVLVLVR